MKVEFGWYLTLRTMVGTMIGKGHEEDKTGVLPHYFLSRVQVLWVIHLAKMY